MKNSANDIEDILILAPTGRDAELACRFLNDAGIEAHACRNMSDLAYHVEKGCGAIVLAEEGLNSTSVHILTTLLSKQPSWSDLPICVITGGLEASETLSRLTRFSPIGNVTLFERPFRPATLVNALQVAIRSRRRQYEVRDLLAERTALAERFRLMAESMPQKIFTAHELGEVHYYNEQWFEYTGHNSDEMKSKGWMEYIHPDDLNETVTRWRSLLDTAELFEIEHRIRRRDGVYRWHLSRARAVKNDRNEVLMFIGSNTDIDDQKNAEEKLEKLVAERTASLTETNKQLESFCYTIAHDLRAPLRAQRSFSMALVDEFGEIIGETGREYAHRIQHAAERLDQLVNDLLAYSRVSREDLPLVPVDLRKVVAAIEEETRFEFQEARARLQVECFAFSVRAHETTLETVIRNLVSNALKFVRRGTSPHIRINAEQHGNWIRLTVADNGIGIAPEYQKQIFGIFTRLHKAGQYPGTGVGLAIVEKGIERLQGRVGVDSKENEGSQFWIELQTAQ